MPAGFVQPECVSSASVSRARVGAQSGLERFAERLAHRARLEHREVLGHALHGRLDRARAARAALDDVALLRQLVVAAIGDQADDRRR